MDNSYPVIKLDNKGLVDLKNISQLKIFRYLLNTT